MTLRDKFGNQLNDVAFTIDGAPILYDDVNNNGRLDSGEMTPVVQPYLAKSYAFGTKTFVVEGQAGGTGCTGNTSKVSYTTDIGVYSGSIFNKITLTVTSS